MSITQERKQNDLSHFVIVDIETIGLKKETGKIIEIAALEIKNWEIASEYNQLINPQCKIPLTTSNLTGIKNSDIVGKPIIQKALMDFFKFIGDMPLVGHNVISFDKPFIEYNLQKAGIKGQLNNRWLDTIELAIFLKPELKKHKLEFLYEKLLGKPLKQKHRAISDCKALFEVLLKLKSIRDTEWDKDWLDHVGNIARDEGWEWSNFILESQSMKLGKIDSYLSVENFIKDLNFEKLKTNSAPNNNEEDNEINKEEEIEKYVNLDLEEIKYYFDEDKAYLKKVLGGNKYEYRRQQNEMALKIAESINQNKHLIVEAATGSGKSMAYLVPSLIWSLKNDNKPVVISTFTNALQDQLLEKDFAVLQALFKTAKIAVVKGREHYVCLRKLKKFFDDYSVRNPLALGVADSSRFSMKLFSVFLANWVIKNENNNCDLDRLSYWLKKKVDGFRESEINSNKDSCQKHFCPLYKKCFINKLRRDAQQANIVIANHSLVFLDRWEDSNASSILPKGFKILVIDEAINIESAVTDASTETYSKKEFNYLLAEFFNIRQPKRCFLNKIKLFLDNRGDEKNLVYAEKIEMNVSKLIENNNDLFRLLEQGAAGGKLKFNKKEAITKYFLDDIKIILENLESNLKEISTFLASVLERHFGGEEKRDSFYYEVSNFIKYKFGHYLDFISVLRDFDNKKYIFYKETFSNLSDFSLNFCVKNIGDYLDKKLYHQDLKSIIFTSATLTYNNNFDFVNKIWGTDKIASAKVDRLKLDYLFNYGKQCILFMVKGLPRKNYDNSRENSQKYYPQTAEFIKKLLIANNGSSLLLFTNKEDVKQFSQLLINDLELNSIPLFSSERSEDVRVFSGNQSALVEEFRDNIESCLIGTAGFREGIDVPGSSLEMVIIVKMPFANFNDPIIHSRQMIYGGFGGYTLPNCIFDLKQAFGRLIRSKTDEGFVFIIDEKLASFSTDVINNLPSGLPVCQLGVSDFDNIYKMIASSKYKSNRAEQVMEQIKKENKPDNDIVEEVPF